MSVSGIGNKVTAERYRTIKKYVEDRDLSCKDDVTVGKIFGVGVSIWRSRNHTTRRRATEAEGGRLLCRHRVCHWKKYRRISMELTARRQCWAA